MKQFVEENIWFIPILMGIILFSSICVVYDISLPSPINISAESITLLCLSSIAFVLIVFIGQYLIERWFTSKDQTTLIWGISFLLFSITFIGLMLKSLGIIWTAENDSLMFFLFRQFMILWAAGVLYGLVLIFRNEKVIKHNVWIMEAIILVSAIVSYIWFYYTTIILNDVHLAMNGLLGFFFIPVCAFIGYLFMNYGYKENFGSMKRIGFGFIIVAISYLGWTLYHTTMFYYLLFSLFIIGLTFIRAGVILLSAEKYKLEPNPEICNKCKVLLASKKNR